MKKSSPLPAGTKQVLIGFPTPNLRTDGLHYLTAAVYRSFLPRGLLLWGAKDSTRVHEIKVGNQIEGTITLNTGIPGRYFAAGKSFEELEALAELGELEGSVEPRQVLEMQEAAPGVSLRVVLSGPYDSLCLWGLTYAKGSSRGYVTKVVQTGLGWKGTMIERRLDGEHPVFEAEGPTAEVVATLLMGRRPRPTF